LQRSREVTFEDLNRRSYLTQLGDAAAHLLSPLM
jgi:hypothetical protein